MVLVRPANRRLCVFVAHTIVAISAISSAQANATSWATVGSAKYWGSTTIEEADPYSGILRVFELGHEQNYFAPDEAGWLSSVVLSHSSDPKTSGYSIALDQGLGNGYAVGLTGSQSKGVAEQTRASVRASTWQRENTLRIALDVSQQKTTRSERDYLDTDGIRVRVASDVSGSTMTLRLTHLTTPTTILMANLSQTRMTARPTATSFGMEGRRYLTKLRGAVHFAYDHYQDGGEVDNTTDYGRVSADSITLRYHQRLPRDLILSSITRKHSETEIPRSPDSGNVARDQTSQIVSLRWRHVKGSWTDLCSEVGLFMAAYWLGETQDDIHPVTQVRALGVHGKIVI